MWLDRQNYLDAFEYTNTFTLKYFYILESILMIWSVKVEMWIQIHDGIKSFLKSAFFDLIRYFQSDLSIQSWIVALEGLWLFDFQEK